MLLYLYFGSIVIMDIYSCWTYIPSDRVSGVMLSSSTIRAWKGAKATGQTPPTPT